MLCKQIKALRLAHNMTQVELANKLNITKQAVSNWENDNIQPSIDMLIKLADLFGVTTDYLLGRDMTNYINAQGLSKEMLAHINLIIKDLQNNI